MTEPLPPREAPTWMADPSTLRVLEMRLDEARELERVAPDLFEVLGEDDLCIDDALPRDTPARLLAPAWLAQVVWEVRNVLLVLPRGRGKHGGSSVSPRTYAPQMVRDLLTSPLALDDLQPPAETLEALFRLGGAKPLGEVLGAILPPMLDELHWGSGALHPRAPCPEPGAPCPAEHNLAGELVDMVPRAASPRSNAVWVADEPFDPQLDALAFGDEDV